MPSLFVIRGRDQGKRFDLTAPVVTLGRENSNAIQLFDTEVSRHHAELRREESGYTLIDLRSSNGSYVNSERVERRALVSGDRVQLGRTLMIFTSGEPAAAANLAEVVNIVARGQEKDGSRIVKSIPQEESSEVFSDVRSSQSPWLARARSNLQIMYRTALAVSHTLDIDQLLGRIMDLIFEWVEADRGCVMLVDAETGEPTPKARRDRKGHAADTMSISRTILDYVMQHKEGVLTSDAQEDDRWNPEGSIVKLGVREAICVPMQGRYGIVGMIYIDTYTPPGRLIQQRHRNRFTEEHLKLMVAIGHQAALAVEDTSYYSAMVQAERLAAVGQAIATLSHHIKNILQGIRGGSYLIQEGLGGEDMDLVRKGWRIVEKNQDKISNLVMDMLTFSKEREPEPVPANINDTAAEVVELMQSRAAEYRVRLETDFDPAMPIVLFDPEAMHRAILNLVTNAIDACEESGEGVVRVTTRFDEAGRIVRVMVDDNGSGIAPEDIKRIFTVFESRKGARGTGLGLSVSQKILHEHGGDIRVESALGKGSRFTIELPVAAPDAADRPDLDETRA